MYFLADYCMSDIFQNFWFDCSCKDVLPAAQEFTKCISAMNRMVFGADCRPQAYQ